MLTCWVVSFRRFLCPLLSHRLIRGLTNLQVFDRVIMYPHVFKDEMFLVGLDNTCSEGGFHVFLDCDDQPLGKVLAYAERLSERLGCRVFLCESSPWKWQLLCYANVSWPHYLSILEDADRFGVLDSAYRYCTEKKGYGVLRVGAKPFGSSPRFVYSVGYGCGCVKCQAFFEETVTKFRVVKLECEG